jgi:ferric-dicitrate binding protein FerR (iron transport regulator)
MSDYLFDKRGVDKQGEVDPEVARLEQLLAGHAHRAPLRPPSSSSAPRRRRWMTAAAITTLAAAATVAFLLVPPKPDSTPTAPAPTVARESSPPACGAGMPGFAFATEGGAARCGGAASGSGVLPIGEWLETSSEVSARVEVADIGNLTVHGDSRLRLVKTGSDEHRLELARGRISALVSAPPRLFVIETPGASAVDLGCAYELAVDDEGRTHLQVQTGAVSLEGHGLVAYVAAGSEVIAVPGRGPGTPLTIDAAKPLRDAVARFDAGDPTALSELLAAADRRDGVTLWNLLGRTEGEARGEVFRRLDALHRLPSSVRERDILAGQPTALEAWRESLEADAIE